MTARCGSATSHGAHVIIGQGYRAWCAGNRDIVEHVPAVLPPPAAHPAGTCWPLCAACSAILEGRCAYAGCGGPADGSECRHPRPEDD